MTIWLIEGTEACGKTTVSKAMARALECTRLHFGPPIPGIRWFEEYLVPVVEAMVEGGTENVVMDRGFLSEFVWAEYAGRHNVTADLLDRTMMLDTFLALDTRVVLLERPLAYIHNTIEMRREGADHFEAAAATLPMYRRYAQGLERYGFDVTQTNPTDWMHQWNTSATSQA